MERFRNKIVCVFVLFLMVFFVVSASCNESKFDWESVLVMPPGSEETSGNQILHFKSVNKPYWHDETSRLFVEECLQNAAPLKSDAEVLKCASDHMIFKGLIIELGVCTGKTINFLAALNPYQTIYGFDSFEGLPEDWIRNDKIIPKGTFGFKNQGEFPPVLKNVSLIKGSFDYSIDYFLRSLVTLQPIALLHVDSDLYSSAITALTKLEALILPGTVIIFDEFYNYPGFENHEFKAFQEFLVRNNFRANYLAYNIYHEQVALIIENND